MVGGGRDASAFLCRGGVAVGRSDFPDLFYDFFLPAKVGTRWVYNWIFGYV